MNQSQIPEMVELLGLLDYVPAAHRSRSHRLLLELAHSPGPPVITASSTKEEPSAAVSALREAVMEMVATTATTPLLLRLLGALQPEELSLVVQYSSLRDLLDSFESRVSTLAPDAEPPISTSASEASSSSAETSAEDAATSSSPSSEVDWRAECERRDREWRGEVKTLTVDRDDARRRVGELVRERDSALAESRGLEATLNEMLQSRDEWRQRALSDEDRITALEAQLAELSPVKPADIAEAFANARAAEEEELDEDEQDGVLSVDVQVHEPLIDERPPLFDIKLAPDVVMVENDENSEPEIEPVVPPPETASEPTPEIDIPVVARECNCSREHWQNTRRFTARERNEGHEISCPMYLKGAHFFPLPGPGETDGSGVYVSTCAWCGETKEMRPYGEDSQTYGALGSKSKDLKAKREASASTKAKGYVPASELTPEELQARKDKRCLDCGTPTGGWSPRCRDCNQKRKAQPETAAAS